MSQIGVLWPHGPQTAPFYSIEVKRAHAPPAGVGDGSIVLTFDGGGRPAGALGLTDAGARQLVRDLVAVLGPEPSAPPKPVKLTEEPGPVSSKPADRPGPRRP
jgi:hypothetical protein